MRKKLVILSILPEHVCGKSLQTFSWNVKVAAKDFHLPLKHSQATETKILGIKMWMVFGHSDDYSV